MVDEDNMEVDHEPPVLTKRDKGKQKLVVEDEKASKQSENLPWVEKYRPSTLDDLISHKDIVATITRFIDENRLPHLLFYGPPGTGKTSTILACARKLYGPRYQSMILELNASDDRGIDVVREQIKDFASTKTIFSSNFKLIVLDEADAMTQPAQAALRRIIEKYTKNVRFCLICNYVSKIIPALQSRCTRFRFSPLENEQIESRLNYIVEKENIALKPDAAKALLKLSVGDMRKVLNILQAASAAFDIVDANAIYLTTGTPLPSDIEEMLSLMLNENYNTAFQRIISLKTQKGYALADMIREIHAYVMLLELPASIRAFLLEHLANAEHALSRGCGEKLQLAGLVGAFQQARQMVVSAATI